ncbi:hypothetical protein B4168_0349 [Anoxybacillus flavithermus]|nr:hypothetical protein B4168_0349 [Anoxybacillus flavithermus]OAO83759.1 hypothetical protein GT23_4069 [Parageobacillus thermoglucosidasius]
MAMRNHLLCKPLGYESEIIELTLEQKKIGAVALSPSMVTPLLLMICINIGKLF